jgi:RNA polymerase sigma-70 factor (ECF subfamily)
MAHRAAGDQVAFKPIFAMLAPRIRAFFLQSFPDAVLADALTETTLVRLRREPAVDTRKQPLKAWIFGIAASVRREELRRRYDLPSHVGESELAQAESRAGPAVARAAAATPQPSAADAARAALARLPESQRVIVHLHRYEELTFEQIAEVLDMTPDAVRSRARVAYQQLQIELRDYLRSTGAR